MGEGEKERDSESQESTGRVSPAKSEACARERSVSGLFSQHVEDDRRFWALFCVQEPACGLLKHSLIVFMVSKDLKGNAPFLPLQDILVIIFFEEEKAKKDITLRLGWRLSEKAKEGD